MKCSQCGTELSLYMRIDGEIFCDKHAMEHIDELISIHGHIFGYKIIRLRQRKHE